MFKLFFSTVILFIFTKNLNAAALECDVDDYLIQNLNVISINSVDLEIKPLVSLGEIPSFISIKVDDDFSNRALNSQLSSRLLKMKINSNVHFYLKPASNGYMDGFYIIRNGDYVTKLDSYCSFNILSNYQSSFIHFEEGDL
ncbi:hypothetical protein N9E52_02310 [Alphaproteobacteria bacterium]|nr:hypothetical protein [Alphaproteobacteria bacterium]